ncbi:hypothetical protein QEN36_18960 [Gordonia alkanivorans]|nr:hypothetical protein [Gordonia alkanivorans]MDH3009364.1 hypothetical protein [Gordonia alkanivorans]MDH3061424.1 hypothetical protein [Gordonia alkanivorans]
MNGVWSGRFEYHLRPDGDGSYTTYRDAVGATTVYGVDPDGRVRQESDPAGRITATDYNANRQPLSITSPGGARTMLPTTPSATSSRSRHRTGRSPTSSTRGPVVRNGSSNRAASRRESATTRTVRRPASSTIPVRRPATRTTSTGR